MKDGNTSHDELQYDSSPRREDHHYALGHMAIIGGGMLDVPLTPQQKAFIVSLFGI